MTNFIVFKAEGYKPPHARRKRPRRAGANQEQRHRSEHPNQRRRTERKDRPGRRGRRGRR